MEKREIKKLCNTYKSFVGTRARRADVYVFETFIFLFQNVYILSIELKD